MQAGGWKKWVAIALTALPAALMVMSAAMKLAGPAEVEEQFVSALGYPASTLVPIGILELVCVALFLVPRTSVLGAILVTGYLGGAIASHVRVGDAFLTPLVLGIAFWAGLYLRDARLRSLLPLRSGGSGDASSSTARDR